MAVQALFKKELTELWRTSKIIILGLSFLFLGLSGPITTKILPDLLKNIGGQDNIQFILLAQPNEVDAIASYFKNMSQMPLLILILVAMGTLAGERERGTNILVLTKPVTRTQFLTIKYLTYFLVTGAAVVVTALGVGYYTLLLFRGFDLVAFLVLNVTMLSYMAFILALVVFCSSLLKTSVAAGGLSFLIFLVISICIGFLPQSDTYSPLVFLGKAQTAMTGKTPVGDFILPSLVGFALTIITLSAGCFIAEKREM